MKDIGIYELLETHNEVYWHWMQEPDAARAGAMKTDVYLSSVNALAESGEMVNIDGIGNRVASTLFGHKRYIFWWGVINSPPPMRTPYGVPAMWRLPFGPAK